MNKNATDLAHLPCRQFKDGAWRDFEDDAAFEISVTVDIAGLGVKRLWAFPTDLPSLVLGHALLDLCPAGATPRIEQTGERAFAVAFEPGAVPAALPWPGPLTAEGVLDAAARFMDMAGRWDATGCFHRAALFDPLENAFLRHVEDIGRHNCLDRLAGWALAAGAPLGGRVLYVSARATASLVAKAVASGYAAMVSRSAVTTAGVEQALSSGMTLVGFSRENRFSVFADPHGRIQRGA